MKKNMQLGLMLGWAALYSLTALAADGGAD